MYPEAGGSSSFARRAFNEFWSFFAAWAQMLTYVATIATSAFFVPHYLGGLFWDALRHSPGDIIFACIMIACSARSTSSASRSRPASTAARGRRLPHAAAAGAPRLLPGLLAAVAGRQRPPRASRRRGRTSCSRSRSACSPTRASRRSRTCPRRPRTRRTTIPAAIARVRLAVFAIYFTLPAVALSALPVKHVNGEYQTLLGLPEDQGGSPGDPVLGVVRADGPRRRSSSRWRSTSACSPRRSSSWPPTPA